MVIRYPEALADKSFDNTGCMYSMSIYHGNLAAIAYNI